MRSTAAWMKTIAVITVATLSAEDRLAEADSAVDDARLGSDDGRDVAPEARLREPNRLIVGEHVRQAAAEPRVSQRSGCGIPAVDLVSTRGVAAFVQPSDVCREDAPLEDVQ